MQSKESWPVPAAESRTRPWHLAVFLAGFFVVWTIRATWLTLIDQSIESPLALAIYSNAIKFVVWVIPAGLFVWRLRRGSPLTALRLAPLPGARTWLFALVITTVYLCLVVVLETVAGPKRVSVAPIQVLPLAILLLQFAVTPFLEELLFRGFVLEELLKSMRATSAVVVDSALFAAIHLPFWLYHVGATPAVFVNVGGVFVFSLIAGALFVRSRSVWPCVAAHVANNLVSAMLVGG